MVLDVQTGYHAQSSKPLDENLIPLMVTMEPNPVVEFSEPRYPSAEIHDYPLLGKVSVYTGRVVIPVPFKVKSGAVAGQVKIAGSIRYQICDDRSCFPPVTKPFEIETQIVPAGQTVNRINAAMFAAPIRRAADSQWSIPMAFGAAILAGLLFNIMPCVLPVLPLKAIGFYEVSQHHRARSFMFGVVFSLGLISVFVVLAMVVLVFRLISWGELYSRGWFIWFIVALLIFLAAGLLGKWNLSLPVGIYRFEPRHDTFGGNFFWGALTAILATPCTAPFLPPLLLWAADRPAYVGVPAMVFVGVGMALPYLLLSAMPEIARRVPRSGAWSELFKQMMGFLVLASAAYFAAGRLIHGPQFWWVVTAVVAVAGVFLIVRTISMTRRPAAIITSAVISFVMLGGVFWWTSRITGVFAASVQQHWQPFSQDAFENLRQSGRPVLVKFTANWCGTCQYIEGTVYRNQSVWDVLQADGVTTLKVDLTDTDAPGKQLLLALNPTGGIPLTAIWPAGGDQPIVLASVYNSAELLEALKTAKASDP